MKTSLRPWRSDDGTSGTRLYLWCPACDDNHQVEVGPGGWDWDGNRDAPTISPSILVTGTQWEPSYSFHNPRHIAEPGEQTTCHSFIRAGRWEFLGDCTHDLAGQTVGIVDLPDWMARYLNDAEFHAAVTVFVPMEDDK